MYQMTLKEASEKLNLHESTIKSNFRRTQKRLLEKENIFFARVGRGESARYIIANMEDIGEEELKLL